jgi:cell division septation protein DedD
MDFMIEDQPTETVTREREIVPAGKHVMQIRSASEGPNEYKRSDANPEGDCLKLCLSTVEGDYKFVWHDIPKDLSWIAANLADALGIKPVDGRLSLTPSDIEGQTLVVEISHYTSKAGKTSAVVKRYVPATATQPKPAAIKPNPKPPVERLPGDDIPF